MTSAQISLSVDDFKAMKEAAEKSDGNKYLASCYCEEKEEAEERLSNLRARFPWPLLPHHVVLPLDPEIAESLLAAAEKEGLEDLVHDMRQALDAMGAPEEGCRHLASPEEIEAEKASILAKADELAER